MQIEKCVNVNKKDIISILKQQSLEKPDKEVNVVIEKETNKFLEVKFVLKEVH